MRKLLKLWGLCLLLALLPVCSTFLGNRSEVTVQDLIVPAILAILITGAIAAGYLRLWKRDVLAGGIAALLTTWMLGFNYDTRLTNAYAHARSALHLPELGGGPYGITVSIVFIICVVVLAYWIGRGLSTLAVRMRAKPRDLMVAITLGVGATFIFSAAPLVRDLAVEWPQFFYKPPKLTALPKAAKGNEKPDVYYILLDRYASQDVLKNQFGFDNADFLQYLDQNGYYVNPSAHNNYPYTTMSVASTMNADYHNDIVAKFGQASQQTVAPFNESIRNSPVAQEFKSLGYNYDLIGNWYETSNLSGVADATYQPTGRLTFMAHSYILNNFSKNVLTQSVLWRWLQGGVSVGGFKLFSYSNMGDVDLTHYQLTTLKNLAQRPAGGRFIFAHILVPHDPYYFNADGSLSANSSSDNAGKPIKQKYLGQVQFINSQMEDILSTIREKSGSKSVVVLQSDEGPYPVQLNDEDFDESDVKGELGDGDMRAWSDLDLQMKMGNLAAYYAPAAHLTDTAEAAADTQNQKAADSVNIFRLVFNSYFGASLPYLPDCYYAYPDGRNRPLSFADITARLTGQPADARCRVNGTVSR